MTPNPAVKHAPPPTRRFVSWLLLYVFGLSVTTLLVGVWGRAVSGDEAALRAGVRAAVEAELVADRVEDWLVEAIGAGSSVAGTPVADTLQRLGSSPEMGSAVDTLVTAIVDGAVAEPGTVAAVDVGSALAPVGRVMAEQLAEAGLDVPADSVTEALAELEPIVIAAQRGTIAGAAATARGVLTTVAVVASLVALASGGLAIALADDRIAMARTLVLRVAVGAVTFVIVARIGAWALDPERGRSPIAAGGSVLLRSNSALLVAIAVAGAVAGAGLGAYRVRRRTTEPPPQPVQASEDDHAAGHAAPRDRRSGVACPTEERVALGKS
ncbi:hypothetical protein BH24ACT7_BH24ACT7_00700 [soil metagenome]